jgi:tripartite-type tricarboxylate transporter receptor subunit TctC
MAPTRRALLALPALLPFAAGAQAPWQPSRRLRLIVPFYPGGSTDLGGRSIAERLSETLGQPVVVKNRTGAGGGIGVEAAARSAPDGYAMLAV